MTGWISPLLSFLIAIAYVWTGWLGDDPNGFWGAWKQEGSMHRGAYAQAAFPWVHLFGSIVLIWFKESLSDLFYFRDDMGSVYGRRTEIVGWVFLLLPFAIDLAML